VRALGLLLVLASASIARAQDVPDAPQSYTPHVHFEADGTPLVLSTRDADGAWITLGVAPSDLRLAPGPTELALSQRNHAPVRIPILLEPLDGMRLVGHYESRQTLRELGVGILLGTAVVALIGIAFAIGGFLAGAIDVGIGSLVTAGAVALAGGATGIALATLEDLATIDVL
jgi:hypothetical protein